MKYIQTLKLAVNREVKIEVTGRRISADIGKRIKYLKGLRVTAQSVRQLSAS
ncbi:hypothetical protein [Dyadobacter luticola]|uniref:hypothetical protein n=1 Tax=Dyadobacter luticola TaxID=1979387 RepID=UPI001485D39E|nr:hypothetical protein [Dyadobacter luticola]